MKRASIADIAARLGISKSAVSYALNDRPGVSAATREKVRLLATELGWFPSSSARALSGGPAAVIGMVLSRPPEMLGVEPYLMRFVSGVERVLASADVSLMLRVVGEHPEQEAATYRKWWGERRVDGVILMDERWRDPRVEDMTRIGMPAVLLGGPVQPATEGAGVAHLSCLWTDHGADVDVVVQYLMGLGHKRIAYVGGPRVFQHERRRRRAFRAAQRSLGFASVDTVETAYTGGGAARVTRDLLSGARPPTAIVYGSDLMATGGLSAAGSLGVDVPGRVSLVSWEDSTLCTVVHPELTSLRHDVGGFGARAATTLLELLAGAAPVVRREPTATITVRDSTAPRAR